MIEYGLSIISPKENHDFGVGWKLCHSFLAIDNDIYSRWYIATIGNCADKK